MDSRWPAVDGDFHSPFTLTVHEERSPVTEHLCLWLRVAEMTLISLQKPVSQPCCFRAIKSDLNRETLQKQRDSSCASADLRKGAFCSSSEISNISDKCEPATNVI